ncbi:MAG: hypothetical protein EBU31_11565 [Proteobacteria bacterium]|nr:hypothetical protein [Pseudomonadota bacterium]
MRGNEEYTDEHGPPPSPRRAGSRSRQPRVGHRRSGETGGARAEGVRAAEGADGTAAHGRVGGRLLPGRGLPAAGAPATGLPEPAPGSGAAGLRFAGPVPSPWPIATGWSARASDGSTRRCSLPARRLQLWFDG